MYCDFDVDGNKTLAYSVSEPEVHTRRLHTDGVYSGIREADKGNGASHQCSRLDAAVRRGAFSTCDVLRVVYAAPLLSNISCAACDLRSLYWTEQKAATMFQLKHSPTCAPCTA